MNKRGFTLIELLAVIVILAIIALIATPIVLNIISDAKQESGLRSADFYLDALELSIAQATLDGQNIIDNTYNILDNGNLCLKYDASDKCIEELKVEVKGETPESGTITILNGEIDGALFTIDNKEITKNFKGDLIYSLKLDEVCELKEGTAKTVGAKYLCDLGDGERFFYVLEVKPNQVTLILNGNYDETTQAWCNPSGENPSNNSCNADGLTFKLDEIARGWTKVSRNQITIPNVEQVAIANGKNYTTYPTLDETWLFQWEGNEDYNEGKNIVGYWTSSLSDTESDFVWHVAYSGLVHVAHVGIVSDLGVRPVITLPIKSILPDEYQQVEYIESTGTQYILTNVIPNQDTGFDITFLSKNAFTSGANFGCVFGARTSSGKAEYQLTTFSNPSDNKGALRIGSGIGIDANLVVQDKMTCSVRNGVYIDKDNVKTNLNETTFEAPSPISLFALNENGNVIQNGKVQLYGIKLYNKNYLLHDYIPCYRKSDGAVGMYDLVENKFCVNSGTGDFLKGKNV